MEDQPVVKQELIGTGMSGEAMTIQAVAAIEIQPAGKLRKKPLGGPELTEYNRVKAQESRQRKADKKQTESLKCASKLEVTKAEAMGLLARRVANAHLREVCYDLGLVAAQKTGIFPNRFYWAHGLTQALASAKAKTEKFLEMEHSAIVPSEVIHQGDAYAIWDFSVSYREPDVTFDDFVQMRRLLKSDWFELGNFIGIPFEEKPWREWQQFLPQFTPDGLQPGYNQQDMRAWLARQKSPTHPVSTRDYLLMASRNTMKSTASLCLAACAVLCAPSIRLLLGACPRFSI